MTPSSRLAVLAVALAALSSSTARADDGPISLRYDINAKDVQQGEAFQLDVVLTVRTQKPVEELVLPDFPRGLTVVQQRKAQSTQIGYVNGKQSVSAELRYMFLLRADEAGTFTIPEATARVGRSVARAAPVVVKVVASGAPDPAVAAVPDTVPGARFGKNPPSAFLEITVDHDSAYVGQQITATTEVYSEQPLAQWPRLGPLKPPGFLCTPLLGDDRPNPSQRSVGGRLFYVYLVNKDALFPLSEGDVVIPPQTVGIQPAGDFFAQPRARTLRSGPLKLKVKPLPTDGRPARFSPGNVGVWQLAASVRPQAASLTQPVTLTITATGTGSLEQLQMPAWDGGDAGAVRVFPATTKIQRRDVSADAPELGGRVVEEMLVQPQKNGDIRIPSFSLSYFDPWQGQYKTTSTQPIVVPVRGGRAGAASTSSGAASGPRQTIENGARPLKSHVGPEDKPGEAPVAAGAFFFAGGLVAFAFGAWRRKRTASAEGKRASIRKDRQRALDEAKARGDLAGLERVLLDALAERCGDDVKACATADLGPLLSSRGLGDDVVADLVKLIRDVEAARYSPAAGGERARMAEQCIALVGRVEAA